MERNRIEEGAITELVNRRKKKLVKHFIGISLLAEQKVPGFKVHPSSGGEKDKYKEEKEKYVVFL